MRWLLFILVSAHSLVAADPSSHAARENDDQALVNLRRQIESVLTETGTPGAGVAIVRGEQPVWCTGVGLADVESKQPVSADTLFRVGSVSKIFIGLSLLKLQREGKLDLQDSLQRWAPSLGFNNPWEATDPVRLVHLLEHTSGWDEMAFGDNPSESEPEVSLAEGLAFRPSVRRSRWRPGTRYAYTNIGPAAAAFVVERASGLPFEEYVEQTWFRSLRMNTATYFKPKEGTAAKLYEPDGVTPYPYLKIKIRPSGSVLASAREMGNLVSFLVNRGRFEARELLPASDIERMERATSTLAARQGLPGGYGLGNYTTIRDGRAYLGHEGGLPGAMAELGYLPNEGVGYVIMINSLNFSANHSLSVLVRNYLTQNFPLPQKPPAISVSPATAAVYSGWYEPATSRAEYTRCVARILGLSRFTLTNEALVWDPLRGKTQTFLPVTDLFFRHPSAPLPMLALIADRSEGTFIQIAGVDGRTFQQVPAWKAWLELAVSGWALFAAASTLALAAVWMPRWLRKGPDSVTCLSARLLVLAMTLAAGSLALFYFSADISSLGRVSLESTTLFTLTLAFPLLAVVGTVQCLRLHRLHRRSFAWWHSFGSSVVFLVVAVYLASSGMVGLRTWH